MKTLVLSFAGAVGLLALFVISVAIGGDPHGGQPIVVVDVAPQDGSGAVIESKTSKKAHDPQGAPPLEQGSKSADIDDGSTKVAGLEPERASGSRNDLAIMRGGPLSMAVVPVVALVEDSRYGPLPKISDDGRRPSDIYAKPTPYRALPQAGEPARIAILVSGLGLSELATNQAINMLPGGVTLAFSPYGRNLQSWVRLSRQSGHEVMLQIPLEPFDYPDNDPGPHTLLTNLPPEENLKRLQWLMARFTGYVGVTNHMGAKFASTHAAFQPVLEEVKSRGLIFLDDGTATRSTAGEISRELGLDFSAAHIVIDDTQSTESIDKALSTLEAAARENGLAIGVASSLPITIQRISEWSRTLSQKDMVLVPISAAIHARPQS